MTNNSIWKLLVERADCPIGQLTTEVEVLDLLGSPRNIKRTGQRKVLVFERAQEEGFWAFWFINGELYSFEMHGRALSDSTQFPQWFVRVGSGAYSPVNLVNAGFRSISNGDATVYTCSDGVQYCEAVFFDSTFDRFEFGWERVI